MLSINGLKSSKLSELIVENHSSVVILIFKIIPSIGMHGHKPIKKKLIINFALPGKLKLTIKLPNLPKYKDK